MHIYCSGIGGVAIGPLAMIALDAGYEVSGSDLQQSEMVDFLRDRGMRIYIGHDGSGIANEHIEKPIDWFVYTSALPADHPELVFAREHGIKTSKRDEFLNLILQAKNLSLVAIAGTHGKTTTTGMAVWALKQLGIPVSYSIGTSISFGPPAEYQPGSEFFVYECDEYDRNFLNFHPQRAIIASYDYDHPDTYPTPLEYQIAFQVFLGQSRYSYLWDADAEAIAIKNTSQITIMDRNDPGISRVKLVGKVMRNNAWLAAQCLNDMLPHIPLDKILATLNTFPGTNRRFEKLADNLYSDYGHHPSEITATIELASELNQNVVVVYQPHQNIRQHEIIREDGYQHCFDGTKLLYWLPTYLSREDETLPVLSRTELIATTSEKIDAEPADMNDTLWQKIEYHRTHGDLVVCFSAGDLDRWLRGKVA